MTPYVLSKSPQEIFQTFLLSTVVVASIIGLILWLGGARFSKTIIPMALFSIGSSVGIYLPQCFGWNIDGWATALAAGLLLGASGLFLHRFWVGVGIGGVLSLWAVIVTWHQFGSGAVWVWQLPKIPVESLQSITSTRELYRAIHLREYLLSYWEQVPYEVRNRLPYSSAAGLVIGLFLTFVLPRTALAFLYSLLGVSLLALGGYYAMQTPSTWAARLPRDFPRQMILVAALTVMGMLIQWQTNAVPRSNSMRYEVDDFDDGGGR